MVKPLAPTISQRQDQGFGDWMTPPRTGIQAVFTRTVFNKIKQINVIEIVELLNVTRNPKTAQIALLGSFDEIS